MSETPVVEAMNDIAKTIENPSLPMIAEDLAIVLNLVNQVKAQLNDKHPSLINIFNYLLGLKA